MEIYVLLEVKACTTEGESYVPLEVKMEVCTTEGEGTYHWKMKLRAGGGKDGENVPLEVKIPLKVKVRTVRRYIPLEDESTYHWG